ncbi:unnamed protein product [Pocillopora meandrina]|uniref:Uncharacterized protein n=1 Tax=Pocillopora meandrina TaxID=46732 RepID=A0AAU9XR23_9CNID|nr:unnamed protein product [Pocillopora meandrina]
MFLMQVEAKLISIKEKLLYLLHSVGPKVREGIAYLKPETVGYRTVASSYGHNFILPETVELLKLKQIGHEMRKIFTVNGTKVRSMPIFDSHIRSLDGRSSEQI